MNRHERQLQILSLMTKPMTFLQIAEAAGVAETTARFHVEQLHKAKRVHVVEWIIVQQHDVALFIAGPGEDAPKPGAGANRKSLLHRVSTAKAYINFRKVPAYSPNHLLNKVMEVLGLENDNQLAKAIGLHRARICKVRSKGENLSASFLLALHDATGVPVDTLREWAVPKVDGERKAA